MKRWVLRNEVVQVLHLPQTTAFQAHRSCDKARFVASAFTQPIRLDRRNILGEMRFLSLAAATVLTAALASAASAEPFAQLRHAYATRNAAAAAAAYAPDGEVVYRYTGTPEERHIGRAAIASSFRALFAQIDSKQTLDLNFRTIHRQGRRVSGVYRLRVGKGISYGRFNVELAPDGSFARDLSTAAPPLAFEEAAGPLMLEADEDLDRAYYGRLTGRYHLPSGCDLVVTRSVVRLFARNTCTGEWRGLVRVSGRVWTAGDKVLSDKALATYRFAPLGTGSSAAVEVTTDRETVRAVRRDAYRLEEVLFTSRDGTKLTGTLYLPIGLRLPRPATVLIHGSGPQDRDGYFSSQHRLLENDNAGSRLSTPKFCNEWNCLKMWMGNALRSLIRPDGHQVLPGCNCLTASAQDGDNDTTHRSGDGNLHLHRLEDDERVAFFHPVADLNLDLPDARGYGCRLAPATGRNGFRVRLIDRIR